MHCHQNITAKLIDIFSFYIAISWLIFQNELISKIQVPGFMMSFSTKYTDVHRAKLQCKAVLDQQTVWYGMNGQDLADMLNVKKNVSTCTTYWPRKSNWIDGMDIIICSNPQLTVSQKCVEDFHCLVIGF